MGLRHALGRLVLTKQPRAPSTSWASCCAPYANVPVLGVAPIAIIIGIDKFDLLGLGGASLSRKGDGDDDFPSPENKMRSDLVKERRQRRRPGHAVSPGPTTNR